jgi:hypothetical protein
MKSKSPSSAKKQPPLALKALQRAAKNALELGKRTGTPVYVLEKGKIVDIAKRPARSQRKAKSPGSPPR